MVGNCSTSFVRLDHGLCIFDNQISINQITKTLDYIRGNEGAVKYDEAKHRRLHQLEITVKHDGAKQRRLYQPELDLQDHQALYKEETHSHHACMDEQSQIPPQSLWVYVETSVSGASSRRAVCRPRHPISH